MPDWLGIHYHIRWSGKTPLDWERFTNAEDAESSAARMVRRGESYSVEKFGGDCVRCKDLREDWLREMSYGDSEEKLGADWE